MLFGKLLPKEGNFFELFNQHAERIAAGRPYGNAEDVRRRSGAVRLHPASHGRGDGGNHDLGAGG